jgi:hypothetical protein
MRPGRAPALQGREECHTDGPMIRHRNYEQRHLG